MAGILAGDVLLAARLIINARDTEAVLQVAVAAGVGFVLALLLVASTSTLRWALYVSVTLLGLDAVAFVILTGFGRPVASEAVEWAMLPALIATFALGIILTIIVSVFATTRWRRRVDV